MISVTINEVGSTQIWMESQRTQEENGLVQLKGNKRNVLGVLRANGIKMTVLIDY